MASIKVVKTDAQTRSVSDEERKIIFNNMAKRSPLDYYHFNSFVKQEKKIVSEETGSEIPDIFNILIRNTMSHPFITPIWKTPFDIKNVKHTFIEVESDGIDSEEDEEPESVDVGIIVGGDAGPKPSLVELAKSAKTQAVSNIFKHSVQLNRTKRIVAYVDSLEFRNSYIADKSKQFDVCGYIIDTTRYNTEFGDRAGRDYISQIQRGIYNYPELASESEFLQPLQVDKKVVIFQSLLGTNSDNFIPEVKAHLVELFDTLQMIDEYYRSSDPVMNFNYEIDMFTKGKNKKSDSQSALREILYRERGNPAASPKKQKIDPTLIKLTTRVSFICKIPLYSEEQIQFDLLNMGLFYLWEHVSINGFDKEFDEILLELQKHKKIENAENMELEAKYKNYANNVDVLSLIKKQLGPKRISKIDINKQIETQLNTKEKSMLKAAVMKRDRKKIKNDCTHVDLINYGKKIQTDYERKQYLKDLKKYISDNKGVDGIIQCKDCKQSLLCTHALEELVFLIEKTPLKIAREKMLKYAADFSQNGHIYCKYCGEEYLEELNEEENDFLNDLNHNSRTHDFSMNIDELQTQIWGEVSYLVYQRLYFKNIHNVKNLIKFITTNIYDSIYEIEKRLNKSRTNTVETIQERIRLYSAIYAVASLISIVNRNKNKIWFATKNTKKTDKLEDLFKHAMITLIDSKNISISKFKISNANLLLILKKAYTQLSEKRWIEVQPKHELIDLLESEPNFNYLYEVLSLSFIMRGKLPPAKDNINKLFTKTVDELKGAGGLYEFFKMPKVETKLPPLTPENFDEVMKHYWRVSFEDWFNNRILNNLLLEDVYNKTYNTRRIETDVEFKQLGRKISEFNKVRSFPLFCRVFAKSPRFYETQDVNLAHMYDSKGDRHKWNIFVYKTKSNNIEELTSQDVNDIVNKKHPIKPSEFNKFTFIDYKCSDCKNYKSKISVRNLEGILDEIDRIENFYRFYEFRCPKDFVHSWVDNICEYCSVTKDQIKSHSKTYYNKYKNTIIGKGYILQFPKQNGAINAKSWKFNKTIIAELAQLTNIKFNILSNLGFTEGFEYNSIKDSSENPSLRKTASTSRINRLHGYNTLILREYQLLKNRSILKQVPVFVKNLIKTDYKSDSLPPIYESYLKNYQLIRPNIQDCTYFVLESLAVNLIMLLKHKMKVVKEFGEYIFEKIMTKDRLHSKPTEMNLGIVWDNDDIKEDSGDEKEAVEQDYDYEEDENEDNEFHGEY